MSTPEEILRRGLPSSNATPSLAGMATQQTAQRIASGAPLGVDLPPVPTAPPITQQQIDEVGRVHAELNPPVDPIEAERQRSGREDHWASRALQRGYQTYGPGALGATVGWFGSGVGNDAIRDAGFNMHRAASERAYQRPRDVEGVGYIQSPGEAAKWAGEAMLEFFPQMVMMGLGGKGMQVAGKKALDTAPGRATADALLGNRIGNEAAKLTARGVDPAIAERLARQRVQDQALIRLGAGLQVGGMYAGSSWAEVLQEHGVDDPGTAAMVGAGAGALTMLLGGQVAAVEAVLGRSSAAAFTRALRNNNRNVLTRIAGEFAKVAPASMLEEYSQESLALLNSIYHDPDVANQADAMVDAYIANLARPVESALTVAVAAGVPGAVARGVLSPRTGPQEAPPPDATPAEDPTGPAPGAQPSPEKEATVAAAVSPAPVAGVKQPVATEYDDMGPFVSKASAANPITEGTLLAPISGTGRPVTVMKITDQGTAIIADRQTKQTSLVSLAELEKNFGHFNHEGWLDTAQREIPGLGTARAPKATKLPGEEIERGDVVYATKEEAIRNAGLGEKPIQTIAGWQVQTTQLDLLPQTELSRDVLMARGVPKGLAGQLMDMSLDEAHAWVERQESAAAARGHDPSAAIQGARSAIEDLRRNRDVISEAAITEPRAVTPAVEDMSPTSEVPATPEGITGMEPAPYMGVERRVDLERRKRVSEMTQGELAKRVLINPLTGLWSKEAYNQEHDRKPFQVFIDLDELKWINDNMGHKAGDQLLIAFADAMRSATPNGYHLSGDEFTAQADTLEEAQQIVDMLYAAAEGVTVSGTDDNGTPHERPLRFSFGIGESTEEADRNMLRHKAEREAQGLRGGRGVATPAAAQAASPVTQSSPVETPPPEMPPAEVPPVDTQPVEALPPVAAAPAPTATPAPGSAQDPEMQTIRAELRAERDQERDRFVASLKGEPPPDGPTLTDEDREALAGMADQLEAEGQATTDTVRVLLQQPRALRDVTHNVVQSAEDLSPQVQAQVGADMAAALEGDTLHVVGERLVGPRPAQIQQLRAAIVRSRGPGWLYRGIWEGLLSHFDGKVENIQKAIIAETHGDGSPDGRALIQGTRQQLAQRGLWAEVGASGDEILSYFTGSDDDIRSHTPKMAMRTGEVPTSSVTPAVVEQVLQPLLRKGYRFVVEETPPRPEMGTKGGISNDGTIYLYRSMITGREDLLRTVRHELVGHLGMRAVVSDSDWTRVKDAILGSSDEKIRALRFEVERRYPGESVNTQVNEMLAIAAERDPQGNLFSRLWGLVKVALRKAGLLSGAMSWSELQGMLLASSMMVKHAPTLVRGAQTAGMMADGASQPQMMFSQNPTTPGAVHKPTDAEKFDGMMPGPLTNAFGQQRPSWRSIIDGVKAAALPHILKVAPLQDVAEVFGKSLSGNWRGRKVDFVRDYQRMMLEQSRVTDGRRVQAFHNVQAWTDIAQQGSKKLNGALEFATLRNFRLGEPANRQPWTTEQWVESGMQARFGELSAAVNEMNRLWAEVPQSHKDVWHSADRDMGKMFGEVKEAVKSMVERNLGDSDRKDDILKAIDERYQKLKGTYVPLMRFGDYGITEWTYNEAFGAWEKSADQRFDSAVKAMNALEILRKDKDPEKIRYTQYSQLEALEERLSSMDTSIFQSIRNAVETGLGNSDVPADSVKANVDTVMGMVADLFIEDIPNRAFAHHEQHRSGLPGYSTDFARSYENYILRGSAVLGAVRYGSQRSSLLRDMKDFLVASRSPEFEAPENFKPHHAAAVYNSLVEREAALTMNPGWAVPSLSKLTFLQLLTSPSQWLVNLSQVPLVWLPLAAGRWGMSKAAGVMTGVMRDAASGKFTAARILADDVTEVTDRIFARDPRSDEFVLSVAERNAQLDRLPKQMQELVALRQLADSGKMQLGYAHALLAGAEHGHDSIAGSWGRTMDKFMHHVSFFMRHSEEVNRKASMLGAFRLARDQGKTFTQALEDGFYFTDRSQYDYTRQNRVPLLKSGAWRLVLQVQSFRIMTLAMLTSEAYKAFRQGDREAARALGWLQASSALIAGVRGMPVYGLGMMVVSALQGIGVIGDEDDPKDFNMEFELGLRGVLGEGLGMGVSRGLPAMFGMDLHSRTQLANLHESSMMSPPESLTGAARANWQAAVLIGPAWNNVIGMHKLVQSLDRGDPMLKAVSEIMPKPMKDAINTSYTLLDDEPIRGAQGRAIMEAEQVGGYPLLLMGLGIMPTVITTKKIEDRYVADRVTVLGQNRTRIVSHLSRAIMDSDAEAIEEWQARAIDFNRQNPHYGIMGSDLSSSVKMRYRKDLGIPTDNYIYEAHRTLPAPAGVM